MVTVLKSDKQSVRICLDPEDLNNDIQREHHPMRTVDDISDKLAGAKFFSKLDANCGYWQIQLDENEPLSIRHLGDGSTLVFPLGFAVPLRYL